MIDKKTLNGIFAVLSVLVLVIPISVAGYMEEKTTTNIIAVQGNYGIGETFGLYDDFANNNLTDLVENWIPANAYDQVLGWDDDNNTIFNGNTNAGTYSLRDGIYYGDYTTYIGAGEHTTTPTWSDLPQTTYTSYRQFFIPLNITCSDLAEYDFARIHSDIVKTNGTETRIYYETTGYNLNQINPIVIDDETDLFTIGYDEKNILNANPNGSVYISFIGINDYFDESQISFDWMIEANVLETSDYVFGSEYTDTTIWVAIMIGMNAFYLFVVVFANPVIDIKIDNGKKNKWRK